jgi:hypothetical protein
MMLTAELIQCIIKSFPRPQQQQWGVGGIYIYTEADEYFEQLKKSWEIAQKRK